MKKCIMKNLVSLLVFCLFVPIIETIEPLTTSVIVGGALSAGAVYQFWDDKIKVSILTLLGLGGGLTDPP